MKLGKYIALSDVNRNLRMLAVRNDDVNYGGHRNAKNAIASFTNGPSPKDIAAYVALNGFLNPISTIRNQYERIMKSGRRPQGHTLFTGALFVRDATVLNRGNHEAMVRPNINGVMIVLQLCAASRLSGPRSAAAIISLFSLDSSNIGKNITKKIPAHIGPLWSAGTISGAHSNQKVNYNG